MEREPPTWLSDDPIGLQDFWRVYDARHDELNEATLEFARGDAAFGPVLAAMSKEQLAAQQAESRARLAAAIAGEWAPYESNLRTQGVFYARLGVAYSSWYRLVRVVARRLLPHIVAEYEESPERMTRALLAMQAFFDRAMAVIAESYLEAKQQIILEREEDLAITLDSIGDGVIATDQHGVVVRMNPIAQRLTGWTLAEAKGRPLAEVFRIVNEMTRAPVESPADLVLREGAIVGLANHTLLIARDGSERPIADSGAPVRGVDGVIRGVVLVFRDQTEERAANARLHESRETLTATLAGLHEGVAIADTHGNIIYRNPTSTRLFPPNVETEVFFADSMTACPPTETPMARALRGQEVRECELFVRSSVAPNGIYVSVNAGPIRGERGESLGAVASFRDISQRRQLEQQRARSADLELRNRQIQEASRLKSEFLANMSHELRTPLNAILGFGELLHDGIVTSDMPQYQDFVGDIVASGRHLLQLINDILDLSKVEAGKLEFHPESIDLKSLLGEVVAVLRTVALNSGVSMAIGVAPDVSDVSMDAARLKQVLYNYLSNAIKFTPAGGTVTLRARLQNEASVLFEVEDTGIGIAPADIGRLFNEFQQLDAGSAKRHGGTGLGLALTRRLVEAQGGSVGVRSVPGKGSVFTAVLPRRMIRAQPLPAPRTVSASPSAPVVLVVEDDAQDQAHIVRILAEAGYAVETASTGTQAIARCRERAYDAITLDLILPDLNGTDVLRAIRAEGKSRDVPVIVVSVVSEKGAVAGYRVHDLLPKPIDAECLLGSLRRANVIAGGAGHVLVVDDDGSSLRLMAATLAQLGYKAVCVQSGAEALHHAGAETPAAVILDLMMPEMTGFEFLDQFRELPRCAGVPVIIWTIKDLSSDEEARLRDATLAILRKGRDVGKALVAELAALLPNGGRS
jgi:PAS domain S-box-containing protein